MVRKTSSMYLVLVKVPLLSRLEVRMVCVGDGGVLGVEGDRGAGRVAGNGTGSFNGIGVGVGDGESGAPSESPLSKLVNCI